MWWPDSELGTAEMSSAGRGQCMTDHSGSSIVLHLDVNMGQVWRVYIKHVFPYGLQTRPLVSQ